MRREHHRLIIHAAAEVARDAVRAGVPGWEAVAAELGPAQTTSLADWAAAADDVEDIVCDAGPVDAFVRDVSSWTACQHFHNGWSVRTDQSLPRVVRTIGEISTAQLRWVRPDWLPRRIPLLATDTHSPVDWENALFPSAETLATWYHQLAVDLAQSLPGTAYRCLGYCCHLLADLTVPHHYAGVVLNGHSAWEAEAERVFSGWPNIDWGRVVPCVSWEQTLARVEEHDQLFKEHVDQEHWQQILRPGSVLPSRYRGAEYSLFAPSPGVALDLSLEAVALTLRAVRLWLWLRRRAV